VRTRFGQACAALVLAAGLACVLTLLWATVTRNREWAEVANYFFLAVSCSWAVLLPAAFWTKTVDESWKRRVVLLGLGLLMGLGALWLGGYQVPGSLFSATQPAARNMYDSALGAVSVTACYLLYFGLAFFVMRWWKMAEPQRLERFSLFAVLVTV